MPDSTTTTASRSKGTSRGFHFLNEYQVCPWRFYLHYVLGLEPVHQGKALLFGTAVHAAKEAFYKDMQLGVQTSTADFVSAGVLSLASQKDLYERRDDFDTDAKRLGPMLAAWHSKWAAHDLDTYEVLAVEEEIKFPLPGGFSMTVRPDAILQVRMTNPQHIVALETKSTSKSVGAMQKSVACSGQVDAQLLGLRSLGFTDPDFAVDVLPDILYQRQNGPILAERPCLLGRSKRELAEAALGFSGIASEIAQKCAAIEAPDAEVPPEFYFPRNGLVCGQFGCAYETICKARTRPGDVPCGFLHAEASDASIEV